MFAAESSLDLKQVRNKTSESKQPGAPMKEQKGTTFFSVFISTGLDGADLKIIIIPIRYKCT